MNARVLLMICLVICAVGPAIVEAGFGCPGDQIACHNHCRSTGFGGGYCAGFLKQTCQCYYMRSKFQDDDDCGLSYLGFAS